MKLERDTVSFVYLVEISFGILILSACGLNRIGTYSSKREVRV